MCGDSPWRGGEADAEGADADAGAAGDDRTDVPLDMSMDVPQPMAFWGRHAVYIRRLLLVVRVDPGGLRPRPACHLPVSSGISSSYQSPQAALGWGAPCAAAPPHGWGRLGGLACAAVGRSVGIRTVLELEEGWPEFMA